MTSPNVSGNILPLTNLAQEADMYRSQKLFSGSTGLTLESLRLDPDFRAVQDSFIRRGNIMNAGTCDPITDTHRRYAPILATVLSDPLARRGFMRALDRDVADGSDQLKSEAGRDELDFDVLIVGGGLHTAILAARLRYEAPGAKIGVLAGDQRLGGQFRSYGDRPVFYGNSRAHRRQNNAVPGLPGGKGNLNSLGSYSPLQITDFISATNFNNLDLGDTAAIVTYLSADVMTNSDLATITPSINRDGSRSFIIEAVDDDTGGTFPVTTTRVVLATGAGERDPFTANISGSENVLTVEQLLSEFGDTSNQFPMERFIGKTVGVAGAGDSGKIAWELLAWLAPQEAYGRSTIQFGGAERGYWWGCGFENREQYCDITRSRYRELGNFIVRDNLDYDSLIVPIKDRALSVISGAGGLLVNRSTGPVCDVLINALPLRKTILAQLGIDPSRLTTLSGRLSTTGEVAAIAAQDFGSGAYFVGPAADLPLTQAEVATFDVAAAGRENPVSLWATGARTDAFGRTIGPSVNQTSILRR